MKTQILLGALMVGLLSGAQASITSSGNVNGSGTSLGLAIPDGNPVGVTSSLTVSGENTSLSSLTVTLNISGGYNGDLYAYLSYNGTSVGLLNQVGTAGAGTFGFSTSGFNNVTLDDAATANGSIHDVAVPGTGLSYTPDGGTLASFNGVDPNGTWTLFFADLSGGGGTSVLNGWSLNITAVPEPTNVALALFGAMLALTAAARSKRARQLWNGLRKA